MHSRREAAIGILAGRMHTLGAIDWCVIALYLAAVALIGVRAAGKQTSTRDYFLGGRSLPWWAASLSIVATETSAVTYIAVPAKAFAGDWSLLQLILGFVLGRIFLAFVFVDVFYRREYLTIYGFIAQRFGEWSRVAAALMFLFGRLVASGVRLFAGCLAFHVATGVPIEWTIVAIGAFATVLTVAGGIKLVVWTDVLLGSTLFAGGAAALVFLIGDIPGGIDTLLGRADLPARIDVFHRLFGGLSDDASLAAGVLGGFVLTLATHGTDQDIAQRVLTCRSSRGGSLSILGSALLIVPLFTLFLSIGTALWYFHAIGEPPYALPERADHIFPAYIASALPPGVAGFVMAGLLAAALSSLTATLNALASAVVGDFYRPLRRVTDERRLVAAGKVATFASGAVLVGLALAFIGGQENLFALSMKVFSYFFGALLGAFLLGILTRRGSDVSVLCGMLATLPVIALLQLRQFIAAPELAPALVRRGIDALPESSRDWVLSRVPEIAPSYWIILSTGVCLAIGALGSPRRQEESGGRDHSSASSEPTASEASAASSSTPS